jgi:hypothetical protein
MRSVLERDRPASERLSILDSAPSPTRDLLDTIPLSVTQFDAGTVRRVLACPLGTLFAATDTLGEHIFDFLARDNAPAVVSKRSRRSFAATGLSHTVNSNAGSTVAFGLLSDEIDTIRTPRSVVFHTVGGYMYRPLSPDASLPITLIYVDGREETVDEDWIRERMLRGSQNPTESA